MSYKFNYDKTKETFLYKLALPVFRLIIKTKYDFNCIGAENVPSEGRLIIACNHISAIDPGYILISCDRACHFMAKAELFENAFVGGLLAKLQAFPVNRDKLDLNAVRYAEKLLENDMVLGIFPEGTRSPDGNPIEPKNGAGMIALATNSNILPVSIYVSEQPNKKKKKATLRIGEVIEIDKLEFTSEKKSVKVKELTNTIMQNIIELWEKKH